MSASDGGLGIAPGDNAGYQLTFTGIAKDLIPLVENATVALSIVPAV